MTTNDQAMDGVFGVPHVRIGISPCKSQQPSRFLEIQVFPASPGIRNRINPTDAFHTA
jgi:hypothetical protein